MYPLLLVYRYLASRVIPFIAVAAVGLCVALVITVVSVMSGFLDMVRSSGKTLMGDVVVSRPVQGIPGYDKLIDEILFLDGAEAASPVVETYGLLKMPYPAGDEKNVQTVQVWAIEPESFDKVTGFNKTIWWKPPATVTEGTAMNADDPRRQIPPSFAQRTSTMRDERGRPGAILGIHVSVGNLRQGDGSYRFVEPWFMPSREVTLTLAPISTRGRVSDFRDLVLPVVNEFHSGVFQVDKNRIMVPIAEAQKLLRFDAAPVADTQAPPLPDGSQPLLGTAPARATHVLVKAKPGVTPEDLKKEVSTAYERFYRARESLPVNLGRPPPPEAVSIHTWTEQLSDLIGPVEREREMMRVLFSIIYLVCAGLVLSIFWAIVYEKTRDIGVLRAIGAGRPGILTIFLQYGLVIGVAGSALGVLLAYEVVTNINTIHEAIGHDVPRPVWLGVYALAAMVLALAVLPILRGSLLWSLFLLVAAVTLGGIGVGLQHHRGTLIWDPRVYYFTTIPNKVDWFTTAITVAGAIIFSVLGASFPAAKAADVDPVRALRYE